MQSHAATAENFNKPLDGRTDRLRLAYHPGEGFCRQGEDRGFIEDLAHFGRHAGLAQCLQPFAMNARILILVFQLAAALLNRQRARALGAFAPEGNEWVTPAAEAARQITRRDRAGVEVLMEHPERRRVHESVPPRKFLELRIALMPQQRVSLAVDGMHMVAGRMAMGFLVTPLGDLRHMRMHGAVGKDEADVGGSLAALVKLVKLEAGQVVDKIGFPNIALDRIEAMRIHAVIAFAVEML